MTRYCSGCLQKDLNPIDATGTFNYCSTCGIELKALPQCKCGEEVLPWWKYCKKCGVKLENPYGLKIPNKKN